MIYMKHPKQGFVKEVKEKHTDLIKSLETEGWYKCAGKKDVSPYKKPVKKKKDSIVDNKNNKVGIK